MSCLLRSPDIVDQVPKTAERNLAALSMCVSGRVWPECFVVAEGESALGAVLGWGYIFQGLEKVRPQRSLHRAVLMKLQQSDIFSGLALKHTCWDLLCLAESALASVLLLHLRLQRDVGRAMSWA